MDFILRGWMTGDRESLVKNADNPKIFANLRDYFPSPYTLEDADFFIRDCKENDGKTQVVRAIVVDDKAVGTVGVFFKNDVYKKSAELGYWLGEEYWRQGIMSQAVNQLCQYVFDNYDIVRIYAEPFAHNEGSRGVLEKAGFKLEGVMKNSVFKDVKICDSCMYALLKGEQ